MQVRLRDVIYIPIYINPERTRNFYRPTGSDLSNATSDVNTAKLTNRINSFSCRMSRDWDLDGALLLNRKSLHRFRPQLRTLRYNFVERPFQRIYHVVKGTSRFYPTREDRCHRFISRQYRGKGGDGRLFKSPPLPSTAECNSYRDDDNVQSRRAYDRRDRTNLQTSPTYDRKREGKRGRGRASLLKMGSQET